jgi:uncharacterized membrane protein YeiH
MILPDIIASASLIGLVSFALSGMLVGVRKHFDLLGVLIVSTLTATGGGVIRDIVIQRTPKLLTETEPLLIILAVNLVAYIFKLHKVDDLDRKLLFVVTDTIGLVAFSITGALIGEDAGLPIFGVMMLSFVTAVGGGIMRDMLINEIPFILKSEFYGSVALLVGLVLHVLHVFGQVSSLTILMVASAGIVLRLLAYLKDWHLPKLR